MLLDTLKGFVPALLATIYVGHLAGVLAGGAAMLGHWRPLFMGFAKGGKIVATCGGAFLGVAPIVGGIGAGVWIVVFVLFRYASRRVDRRRALAAGDRGRARRAVAGDRVRGCDRRACAVHPSLHRPNISRRCAAGHRGALPVPVVLGDLRADQTSRLGGSFARHPCERTHGASARRPRRCCGVVQDDHGQGAEPTRVSSVCAATPARARGRRRSSSPRSSATVP